MQTTYSSAHIWIQMDGNDKMRSLVVLSHWQRCLVLDSSNPQASLAKLASRSGTLLSMKSTAAALAKARSSGSATNRARGRCAEAAGSFLAWDRLRMTKSLTFFCFVAHRGALLGLMRIMQRYVYSDALLLHLRSSTNSVPLSCRESSAVVITTSMPGWICVALLSRTLTQLSRKAQPHRYSQISCCRDGSRPWQPWTAQHRTRWRHLGLACGSGALWPVTHVTWWGNLL